MEWLISIISGIAGGNIAGVLNKAKSLGPLLNSVLGGAGGALGGLLGGNIDALSKLGQGGNAAAGGVLGFLLPLVAGFLKKGGASA
jgi:hypothetical protein